MAGYANQVAAIHRKFAAQLKKAKTRQDIINAYWKHKAEHERILRRHLKEELADVNRRKSRIPHR